jgi:uncharacterized protein (TIGR04255 family)
MPAGNYRRAPITEAVIDLQYADKLPENDLDAVASKLKAHYLFTENLSEVSVKVDASKTGVPPRVDPVIENLGFKMASSDQADAVLLTKQGLTASRLAPYIGWESFRGIALRNYQLYRGIAGYRKLARMAVRYVNRLDLPLDDGGVVHEQEFVHVGPRLPAGLSPTPLHNFSQTMEGRLPALKSAFRITNAILPPAVLGTLALLLDIDIYRTTDVPQRDQDIWEFFDVLRTEKNRIFEQCVTDKAREMFDRV